MEKYRSFADHGTGIQPFIPNRVALTAAGYVSGAVLLLLRVPVLLVLAAAILLFGVLLPAVVGLASSGAAQLLRSLILKPLLRVALFILGFLSIKKSIWPLTALDSSAQQFKPGHVILSNLVSYTDILVHASMEAPMFAFALEGSKKVVLKGFLGALWFSVKADGFVGEDNAVSLSDAVRAATKAGASLVLFFEGTTTTGYGVLAAPQGILASCGSDPPIIHLRALSYNDQKAQAAKGSKHPWTPAYVAVGPLSSHLLRLVATWSHFLKVTTVDPAKTPSFAALPDYGVLQSTGISRLCEASGLRAMQLTRQRKVDFLKHWAATSGGDYIGKNDAQKTE